MKFLALLLGIILLNCAVTNAKTQGIPFNNSKEPVLLTLAVDGTKQQLKIPASGLETQGIFFSNNSKEPVLLTLAVDRTINLLKIPASGCAYVFAGGKFAHPFSFGSKSLSGTFRNISIGFRDGIQPVMVSSITEGENEVLRIGLKEAKEWQLIEIPKDTKVVKVQKCEFVL